MHVRKVNDCSQKTVADAMICDSVAAESCDDDSIRRWHRVLQFVHCVRERDENWHVSVHGEVVHLFEHSQRGRWAVWTVVVISYPLCSMQTEKAGTRLLGVLQ